MRGRTARAEHRRRRAALGLLPRGDERRTGRRRTVRRGPARRRRRPRARSRATAAGLCSVTPHGTPQHRRGRNRGRAAAIRPRTPLTCAATRPDATRCSACVRLHLLRRCAECGCMTMGARTRHRTNGPRPRRAPDDRLTPGRRWHAGTTTGERAHEHDDVGTQHVADRERGGWSTPRPLARIDKWWRAANYLSVGPDLPARQPAAARAAHARPRQAAPARPLGHHAGPELPLRAPQPRDRGAQAVDDLHHRPGPRRPGPRRERLPRRHLLRDLLATSPRTPRACSRLFRQFSFPGGIPSHVAPETPGSIHEGGELGYALSPRLRRRVRQPRPARRRRRRRRRGRDRPAGHELALATSSSTRRTTASCCRSCTSTATRSPTRPCSRASPTTSSSPHGRATATSRTSSSRASTTSRHDDIHRRFATLLDEVLDEIAEIKAQRATPATSSARAGR